MSIEERNSTEGITVGRLVEVASRTWPGINKPGGVAKVVEVQYDSKKTPTHVNVRYVVGSSREKNVPLEYVTLAPQYESQQAHEDSSGRAALRDRSMLLGRCRRCGSLRTDCGSCDWVLEEKEARSFAKSPPKKPISDLEENFSDTSDDDQNGTMKRLQSLLFRKSREKESSMLSVSRANQRSIPSRTHRRTNPSQWRKRYPSLWDDSSSSSDSDVDLLQSSRRRRMMRRRIQSNQQTSILESSVVTKPSRVNPKKQNKKSIPTTRRSKPTPFTDESEDDDATEKLSDSNNDALTRDNQTEERVSDSERVGATASIGPRETLYDRQLLELEARSRFQVKNDQRGKGEGEDADFIQPEGQEAVENLPDDMVDMSRSIPYKDLGKFFDSMASKVEDEILPDFKLKLANLHNDQRRRQQETSTPAGISKLLQNYHQLWDDVKVALIQNGTDQCRATLFRLMDDKLYRKHRKKLTLPERKSCRGAGVMDARNLRMDAMDDAVESFVRSLKDAVVLCETECSNHQINEIPGSFSESEDSELGYAYYDDDEASSDGDEDLDLLPISVIASSGGSSPPLDPHRHASRVRSSTSKPQQEKPKTVRSTQKGKRTKTIGSFDLPVYRKGSCREKEKEMSKVRAQRNISRSEKSKVSSDGQNSRTRSEYDRKDGIGRRKRTRTSSVVPVTQFSAPRDPKQSISQRMQAFLDANTGNEVLPTESDNDDTVSGQAQEPYRTTKRLQGLRSSTQGSKRIRTENPGAGFSVRRRVIEDDGIGEETQSPFEEEPQFTSCETPALFTQLSIPTWLSGESVGVVLDGDSSDVDDDWEILLSEMEKTIAANPVTMGLLLQRAFHMLTKQGCRTLQEMIASNDKELSLHLRTLTVCVRGLKFAVDDDTPIIFSKRHQEDFLNGVMIQLVDALYSLNLPSAWALDIENKEPTLRLLIPLRNALAQKIPLVETVSRCIIQCLGCQQWRKSRATNNMFVSSLNPKDWTALLNSGQKIENPEVTRIQKLGRIWPRIEADALWRILAFVGSVPSLRTDRSIYRLQIISKLFSTGVLAASTDEKEAKYPPSEMQLSACQQEMGYFSALIRKGVMDDLPKTDTMLIRLIQHSLKLQSDSYEGNGEARACCLPSSSEDDATAKKLSSVLWRMTHPSRFDTDNFDSHHVPVSDFPFDLTPDDDTGSYRKLLFPSSKVLSGCLSLLAVWIEHVPQKKIRRNRLMNSLKVLEHGLLKEASQALEVTQKENTFEDAFSTRASLSIGVNFERVSIFKLEALSYFQVIKFLSMKNETNPSLSEAIWCQMSDEVMRERQKEILEFRESAVKYSGDAYRLYATLKIMVSLLLIQRNVSPWHLSFEKQIIRLFPESTEPDIGKVSFVATCVFACIDCLCDLDVEPRVFSSAYELLILAFHRISSSLARGENCCEDDDLNLSCLEPVLIRCIRVHLTSFTSSHESFHLRFCLGVLRSMNSLLMVKCGKLEAPSTTETPLGVSEGTSSNHDANDEMWGELDDSDLAALDLEVGESKSRVESSKESLLWELLSDALDQSKPSKRYAIVGNNSVLPSVLMKEMSSIGRFLVADSINEICDCFCSAIAFSGYDGESASRIVNIASTWIIPTDEDDEDSQFCSRVARRLTSELCLLAENFEMCRKFVFEHEDDMLFNFLKEVLDSGRLEKFPSCNVERIGENSGRTGTKQALMMLDIFNDDSLQDIDEGFDGIALRRLQIKRRKRAAEIWTFCSKLGNAFSRKMSSGSLDGVGINIGQALLNVDNDLQETFKFSDNAISLENETFKTFRLLRNIVSYAIRHDETFVLFEKLSSWSIMLLANQILRIVQSLKYNDQTGTGREYKKARLSELLSCFVELFVSFGAWTLREGAINPSKTWSFLQTYLRDRLLSPILRSQSLDTTIALQEVVKAARFVIEVPRRNREVSSFPNISCSGLLGCSRYLAGYFLTSILRRSKQFFVATALNKQNLGLPNALLEASIGSSDDLEEAAAWVVGSAFPLTESQSRRPSNRFVWPYCSPLQKRIDDYLEFVEENLRTPSNSISRIDWWNDMNWMKKSFLQNNLMPRLQSNAMGIPKKRRLLKLLKYYLKDWSPSISIHDIDRMPPSQSQRMDVDLVCETIKTIRFNLHRCLMQMSIDNDLASVIFACAMHLLQPEDDNRENSILSWSRWNIQGTKGKSMLDLSSHAETRASYIWAFFQWLHALGNTILLFDPANSLQRRNDIQTMGPDDFTLLRRRWQSTQCEPCGGINEEPLDLEDLSKNLESLDRLLIELEDLFFPFRKKKSGSSTVINVYAKSACRQDPADCSLSTEESSSWKAWEPSVSVKRSLKEMMAVILSNL